MLEPNFSESQFQQIVNTEIVMQLFAQKKIRFHPIVLSLREEFLHGWDSGFYFPWLPIPPHTDENGCNFFIQYKLSKQIEGNKGREYNIWHAPYLRFHIPYSTKT